MMLTGLYTVHSWGSRNAYGLFSFAGTISLGSIAAGHLLPICKPTGVLSWNHRCCHRSITSAIVIRFLLTGISVLPNTLGRSTLVAPYSSITNSPSTATLAETKTPSIVIMLSEVGIPVALRVHMSALFPPHHASLLPKPVEAHGTQSAPSCPLWRRKLTLSVSRLAQLQ